MSAGCLWDTQCPALCNKQLMQSPAYATPACTSHTRRGCAQASQRSRGRACATCQGRTKASFPAVDMAKHSYVDVVHTCICSCSI